MGVWDPVVEYQYRHAADQAAGEEWISSAIELAPDEVLEIFRLEIIPPVDATTGIIKKLRYVTLLVDGKPYDSINFNSIMAPLEHQNNLGVALNLGIAVLHKPITGYIPSAIEATCPKASRGQKIQVKTVADEELTADDLYTIVLKCAKVKGEDKLMEIIPSFNPSFSLNADVHVKPAIPVSLSTFDELPGGLKQSKPQIFPWVTYARNAQATTVNQWYDFKYPDFATWAFQNLAWNLVNKEEAYIVENLAVLPHSNSKAARLYIEGRITNPEFTTRPLPEKNYFYPAMYYDTSVNADLKRAGPKAIKPPVLFHGVKGGIQVVDNGTSIPANGVEVLVFGKKFVLK
jgi:hypothetical protein